MFYSFLALSTFYICQSSCLIIVIKHVNKEICLSFFLNFSNILQKQIDKEKKDKMSDQEATKEDEPKLVQILEKSENHESSRKCNLSLKSKADVLKRLDEGTKASQLAREYGVSKSTISRFKKKKETIQKAAKAHSSNHQILRGSLRPKTEAALCNWYLGQREQNITVTGEEIKEKALSLYKEYENSEGSFRASSGWLLNFKRQFGTQGPKKNDVAEEQMDDEDDQKQDTDPSNVDDLIRNSNNIQILNKHVETKEALRSIDTLIRWSNENTVDSLYITMLRNLKNQVKNGNKIKHFYK